MTTADWSIIISIGSFVIAMAGFIWNIWSKFIYPKASVKVSIQNMTVVNKSGESGEKCISLSVVNHGPTEVTLNNAIAKGKKKLFSSKKIRGLLNPLENFPYIQGQSNGPFSGGLPKKLAVGESFSVYFPKVFQRCSPFSLFPTGWPP